MREFYIFGSVCRGEPDPGSDIDVLAICDQPKASQELPASWSVYSPRRLRQLFKRGTLFAWHLYLEAVPIWPRGKTGFLKRFGPPGTYRGAKREISDLGEILCTAVTELKRGSKSEVYEFGVIALACRDTAMAAAPMLTGRFDFSRYAPLRLPAGRFPLTRREFDYLLVCRRATTRGAELRRIRRIEQHVKTKTAKLCTWSARIQEAVAHE
jgi:hypothetical protein